jgi:AcrR family transcriptional regulator
MSSHDAGKQRDEEALRAFWSGLDLLWSAETTPPVAPRRGLGLVEIVHAAIELADAEGFDAVTMRRVAAKLGSGAMSLSRHVPDKDALVLMMIDAVLGEQGEPQAPSGDWRTDFRTMADMTWDLMRLHRWLPEALLVRPPLTPRGVAGLEWALSVFDGHDLTIDQKMQFVVAVHFTVLSAALNAAIEDRTRERLNMSDEEIMLSSGHVIERIAANGAHPRVIEFVADGVHLDDKAQMMLAVELVLDGIGTRLPRE